MFSFIPYVNVIVSLIFTLKFFHYKDSCLSWQFNQVPMTPDNRGSTVLPECLPKNDDLLTMKHFIHHTIKCVYNGHPWEMARWLLHTGGLLYTGQLCKNIRQLKILGSCSVTVLYRVTKHHIQDRYIQVWLCMLFVKIKFRLKTFNLGWFSISFVS